MEKQDIFDDSGEALAYISVDAALMQARILARQDEARYLQRLGWDEIVWTEVSSEQREDSYRIVLQFRRPARGFREEQTGEEEFLFDLLGVLQDRQILVWPEADPAIVTPTPEAASPIQVSPASPVTQSEAPPTPSSSAPPGTAPPLGPSTDVRIATPSQVPTLPRCAHCQAEYNPDQKFCRQCGVEIVGPSASLSTPYSLVPPQVRNWVGRTLGMEEVAQSGEPATQPVAPPARLECPACRAEYNQGLKFCTKCGARIPDAPSVLSAQPTPHSPVPPRMRDWVRRRLGVEEEAHSEHSAGHASAGPEPLRCSQCRADYSPGQKFCTKCGAGIM
ncbi:MAG: zinc ribbon domain-containing protein [Chloroflexi bacterium]|nr:zinc ribbon domain-containing protein [Chloroflexota bacterium]